ncbi:NAD(P)-dependent oxidoreductase [Pseudomonas lalucatii]|uniref:NAD(P)-dependent oxidoreductase n=1 Tax=Pseudomonas lalucatii TaxID=1424203 RepID=A0ABS5Q025_9PSED|nr:NAD(P)-dependent oxidoreductase [Pseudomonas lalucatii]MBS7661989.1 NAD(P)-dependent oxidoreductase [Pseudomonas lalucatii]MBS7726165.1 NAD(P)-dependent oxidoreductase [Pseudomonas lalucatii]QVM88259.1 NAD(P)-dependent oxidoreductase [Pseudomonas lalucatii]
MKVGFIGLGNVGGKLAGSLLRNGYDLTVRDLDRQLAQSFLDKGAHWADSPKELAEKVDLVITCLPSPAACALVMEGEDGLVHGLTEGKIWLEMSTTDDAEVKRLGALVESTGALAMDCPVSGGCHRAATGNISIFAGGARSAFERVLPVLSTLGRRVLHTGEIGSASVLKVMTNYLATTNLCSLAEALIVCKKAGLDLGTTYEAIRISSGNSFVHETESQLMLNGSRNVNFTMDLVIKDVGLFDSLAQQLGVQLEISPLVLDIFKDGQARYGAREWSTNIVKRLEEACDVEVRAPGFPAELVDYEPEEAGAEVVPPGRTA